MAQKYKVVYFNVTAKAETIRMLLHFGAQEFEDCRLSGPEEWKTLKPTTMFGQLPQLEYDGKTVCQSRAIERMLAKKFGLHGSSEDDQLHIDMVRDCLADMRGPLEQIKWAGADQVGDMKKKYIEESGKKAFEDLEKMINKEGFTVGQKMTWPDIELYNLIEFAKSDNGRTGVETGMEMGKILCNTPNINKLHGQVERHPKIAEWLKIRPTSHF